MELLSNYAEKTKRKWVVITDPHIKTERQYKIFKNGLEYDDGEPIFVRDHDKRMIYEAPCWPGDSVWIDFLNPKGREYWEKLYDYDNFKGTNKDWHIWIDMNEPAVFQTADYTMRKNAVHIDKNRKFWNHQHIHNAYGVLAQKATFDGVTKRDDGEYRPFVLSRAAFIGSQQYGAVWTGDNTASFEFMKLSIAQCLSFGISGIGQCGADIGGFTGFANQNLLAKWYQLGTFYPFFRAHAHISVHNREPWIQSSMTKQIIREALYFRQRLMPYVYSTAFEMFSVGLPMMRPMWYVYPKSFGQHRDLDSQFFFGADILVAPSLNEMPK